MDKMEQTQDEYADTFNGKTGEDSAGAGYGIDPAKADVDAMVQAFAEPDVKVGAPIKIEKIEAEVLPAATGEAATEPMGEDHPEQAKQSAATEDKTTEAAPEFKTFGQAFKYHRAQAMNGGPSTFEWKGKKFTTQLKSELPAKVKAAPSKANGVTEAEKFERDFVNRDQPTAKPADRSMTLVQSKAKEYADAQNAARASGSYADKLKAEEAKRTAEQVIEAQREGKSVVVKRPDATAKAIQQADQATAPDFDSLQYANVGGKTFFGKK